MNQSYHVERQVTRFGASFNGNACKILLNQLDKLRATPSLACLKYVQVLQDFKKVVQDCFGDTLNPTYITSIQKFGESYDALGIATTPKVHAVRFHIEEFCEQSGRGLGFFAEQSVESLHYDFEQIWKRYKVAKVNKRFGDRLRRAVSEYNSLHL